MRHVKSVKIICGGWICDMDKRTLIRRIINYVIFLSEIQTQNIRYSGRRRTFQRTGVVHLQKGCHLNSGDGMNILGSALSQVRSELRAMEGATSQE